MEPTPPELVSDLVVIKGTPTIDKDLLDLIRGKVMGHPSSLTTFLTHVTALEGVIADKATRVNAALATSKLSITQVKEAVGGHVEVLKAEIANASRSLAAEQESVSKPLQEQIAQLDAAVHDLDEQIVKLTADRETARRELATANDELNGSTAKVTALLSQLDLVEKTIEAELRGMV
jgi:septal ring factor EnvC (AmiA/AmiB activator)